MVDKIRRVDYSPAEFLEGVSNLRVEEIGLYWVACSMMYARNGGIANDPAWIGRAAGCQARRARRLIAQLVAKEKLRIDPNGLLINGRVLKVIFETENRIAFASSGGKANAQRIANESPTDRKRNPNNSRNKRPVSRRANGLGSTNHQPPTTNHQSHDSGRQTGTDFFEHWKPSAVAVNRLHKKRPDLSGAVFDSRLDDFRLWARRKNLGGDDLDAQWLTFMRKTHKTDPPKRPFSI